MGGRDSDLPDAKLVLGHWVRLAIPIVFTRHTMRAWLMVKKAEKRLTEFANEGSVRGIRGPLSISNGIVLEDVQAKAEIAF